MKRLKSKYRVYPDTSVFGGIGDDEFRGPSTAFFDLVRGGAFVPVLSVLVADEIRPAPKLVRGLYNEISMIAEWTEVTAEALALRDAYIKAGVLSEQWAADALHVALATVSGCHLIVSWNFRHIVHFQKVPLYNAINRLEGYNEVGIYTPQEVLTYEEKV